MAKYLGFIAVNKGLVLVCRLSEHTNSALIMMIECMCSEGKHHSGLIFPSLIYLELFSIHMCCLCKLGSR